MNRYQGDFRGTNGDREGGRPGGYRQNVNQFGEPDDRSRSGQFGHPGDFLPWGQEARPEYGYSGGIGEGFGFYGGPGVGSQAYDQRGQGMPGGRHSGRGPKGYQRSDQRIREDICDRLTDHPDLDPSEFDVQVQGGEVTLSGFVDDRRQKRMAEDVALTVSGVKDVQNQLRVHEHATDATGTGTSAHTTAGTRATAGNGVTAH